MALTRPRIQQFDTTISSISDPITVLKAGVAQANVDIGFLMNRANGLVSNVALFWSESGQQIVAGYTTANGAAFSNIAVTSYANVTAGNIYASGTNSRHGYTWANNASSAYTVFNSATNSIDTIFG